MDYTPYLQLKPLQTDLDAGEVLDQYNREKAEEAAALKAKRKKYADTAKRIADYQSKFKIEDVEYHFNDEMMRVHDIAQRELFDINAAKESMMASGTVDLDKMRELNSRQSAILTMPKQIKASFDSFDNVLKDYNSKAGKKGGYDDILNSDLISKLNGIMQSNSWRFDEKSREFVFTDPEDRSEKRMSPGQFMMNPSVYGQLKGYVDVDGEENRLVSMIGAETIKVPTKDGATYTTRKSKAVSQRERNNIRAMLEDELKDKDDLLTKVGITKNMTKSQYIDHIMEIAGIKEDVSSLQGQPPKDAKGFGSPEDYYNSNYTRETSERYSLWNDDKENPGIGEYAIKNYLVVPEKPAYNITPQSIVVLSPEEGTALGGTIDIPTEYTANRITKVRQDIPGFKQTGMGEVPVYNGDLTFRVTYTDENGEESVKTIEKGDVIPAESLSGDFKLEQKTEVPGTFWGTNTKWVEPVQPNYFRDNVQDQPMVFGVGKISGNQYKLAIPVIEENDKAVRTINTASQRIKPFDKTGIVTDYMQRRESGEFYAESEVPTVKTNESTGLEQYLNKTYDELIEMGYPESDAKIISKNNKSIDDLKAILE